MKTTYFGMYYKNGCSARGTSEGSSIFVRNDHKTCRSKRLWLERKCLYNQIYDKTLQVCTCMKLNWRGRDYRLFFVSCAWYPHCVLSCNDPHKIIGINLVRSWFHENWWHSRGRWSCDGTDCFVMLSESSIRDRRVSQDNQLIVIESKR